jgi:membrane protease YdiL (CAAX protease family)
MSTEPSPRASKPVQTLLALVVVFVPIPLAMLLALWSEVDAITFAGVVASMLLAWAALRWRGAGWDAVGFRPGLPSRRTLAVVLPATALLIVLGHVVASALLACGLTLDLSRFEPLRGNIAALLAGLVAVWTVAAFGEELLVRGYLMHTLHELLAPRTGRPLAWVLAVLLSSLAAGLAHAYQGPVGMIVTGLIAVGLALTYFAAGRRLGAPILTHGLYDTLGFLVVFLSWDLLAAQAASMLAG